MSDAPTFYYDLSSPYSWLAAERLHTVLPEQPVWKPISYGHVIRHTGVLPWSMQPDRSKDMNEIEQRAETRGLLAPKYPPGWPQEINTLNALRAATFAHEIGKGVAFSLAAFRQQFNAGRSLGDMDTILLAGAACELHPDALLKAFERQSIKDKVKQATEEAIERGVTGVPTVAVGDELFWGDDRLEDAAVALAA